MRWTVVAVAIIAVAGITACSGEGGTGRVDIQSLPPAADGDSGHAEQAAARDAGSDMALLNAAVEIPDIDLIDVTSGATVNLRSVADGDNPLLFWFWAPH